MNIQYIYIYTHILYIYIYIYIYIYVYIYLYPSTWKYQIRIYSKRRFFKKPVILWFVQKPSKDCKNCKNDIYLNNSKDTHTHTNTHKLKVEQKQ